MTPLGAHPLDTELVSCSGPNSGNSKGPLVATGVTDINKDAQSCVRAMDQDMVLRSSPDLDITMTSGDKYVT